MKNMNAEDVEAAIIISALLKYFNGGIRPETKSSESSILSAVMVYFKDHTWTT
ncbi:MAG: hypothetical protein ACE14T_02185 [Syntrophales bacterium]